MNIKTFNNKNNKNSTNTIKRIIPVDNDKVMIIKKEELINSLKIVIGFNNNYLLEILKRMETETVRFKLKGKMFTVIIENEINKVDQEAI